eukprot:5718520-Amphidinium_carterae.1
MGHKKIHSPTGRKNRPISYPPDFEGASWGEEKHLIDCPVSLWGVGGSQLVLLAWTCTTLSSWSSRSLELFIDVCELLVFVLDKFGSGRLPGTSSSFSPLLSSSYWFSLWLSLPAGTFCHIGGMMGSKPIHFNDPTDIQNFGMVKFQATTLLAPGDSAPEPLPLLFFLSGLEGLGGIRDTTVLDQMKQKKWPAGSLLLVAPFRKSSH